MGRSVRIGAVLVVLALIVVGVVLAVDGFTVEEFARRYSILSARIADHPVLATLIGIGIYCALVVSFLPGVPFATVPFGLVYGWAQASLVVLIGTAAGTSLLYFVTRFILPERFGGAAGRALEKISSGLESNLIASMLFLRLMPPVPFTLLNVALPSLKVPYAPYLWTTVIGMAPRLLVYALVGESLRAIVDRQIAACAAAADRPCEIDLSAADFVTGNVVLATALLGLIAAVPVVWRWAARQIRA